MYQTWRRRWHPTPVFLPGKSHGRKSLVGYSRTRQSDLTFTFHFHALEKEMATHSSVLAWRIPGTAEPGGLSSMGSHRVRHDWSDLAAAAAIRLMFRTVLIYKVANTEPWREKDKYLLPVFWLDKKAWTMRTLFLDLECFVHKSQEEYASRKRLFKVFLILDNALATQHPLSSILKASEESISP